MLAQGVLELLVVLMVQTVAAVAAVAEAPVVYTAVAVLTVKKIYGLWVV
jgi:hypothetical protein